MKKLKNESRFQTAMAASYGIGNVFGGTQSSSKSSRRSKSRNIFTELWSSKIKKHFHRHYIE